MSATLKDHRVKMKFASNFTAPTTTLVIQAMAPTMVPGLLLS